LTIHPDIVYLQADWQEANQSKTSVAVSIFRSWSKASKTQPIRGIGSSFATAELEGTIMQGPTSSTFKALATSASSHTDLQVTTTIRQIIKDHERTFGFRPSLKKTRRAIKALVDDGLFSFGPPPLCRALISPFNRPFVLIATRKGMDHLKGLDAGEKEALAAEHDPNPLPDLDLNPPKYLPKLDPDTKTLPPKPHAIMVALVSICKKFGKKGCWPSQDRLLELCRKYHGITMSKSCLNYWTAALECSGWFRKIPRAPGMEGDKTIWKSTYYELCEKAWAWFKNLAALVRKLFPVLGIQKIGYYLLDSTSFILGGGPPNAASPPRFREKEAVNLPVSIRGPSELAKFDYRGLAASLDR